MRRFGIPLGLGLSRGGRRKAFDPRTLSGLQGFYHVEDGIGSVNVSGPQAGWIPKLPDNSGLGRTMISNANTNAPIWNATAVGGKPGMNFPTPGQNAYIQVPNAQAADWTFLHDGTGCTVIVHCSPNTANAICTLVNTTGSTTSRGINIFYDGVNQKWCAQIRNATVQILSIAGANNSSPLNGEYVVVFTYQEGAAGGEAKLRVNGVQVASGDTTAAPSTLAPAFCGWTMGRLGAAGLYWFQGHIRSALAYNRVLTAAELSAAESGMATLETPRKLRKIWTVGDSISLFTYQRQLWDRSHLGTSSRIDFLGTQLAGEIALLVDRQHNGHTAHTIQSITSVTNNVNLGTTPTDVLVIAGTNNTGSDHATTQGYFHTLIQQIVTQRPGARIWIGRPPRRLDSGANGTWIETFAAYIQSYCTTNGYTYVNTDTADNAGISGDNVHPNYTSTGYPHIGNQWADALGI